MTGERVERLRALFEEARKAGRLAELEGVVREFFEGAGGSAGSEVSADRDATGEEGSVVPQTFGMVGASPAMLEVFSLIERVGPSHVPVLIQGETGTGKELAALALHEQSGRKGRFLAENCAAVPASLLESELFGHKRGSFTGAVADRDGHFVAADGGTLFLDEIGDMPLEMQAKLLRVLETSEVRPVGENRTVKVDVRVVAASHRDLTGMVAERSFREDLFYRLNVVCIVLPPLRERPGDVPHLIRFILAREASAVSVAPAALAALEAYSWPGNVRQLENELRRALALGSGTIELADLSDEVAGSDTPDVTLRSAGGS